MTDIMRKINAFYLLSDISISIYDRRNNELVNCTNASVGHFMNKRISDLIGNMSSCGTVFAICGLSYGKIETDDFVLILGPVMSCRTCIEAGAVEVGASGYFSAVDNGYGIGRVPVVSEDAFASYVLTLKFALVDMQSEQSLQKAGEESGDMSECIAYIADNVCDHKLTLENVAYHCGYNPSYLSRKFKRTFGMNFNRYLMNAKLEKSTDYLKNTCKSIAEIAADLYFSSQSHFQNAFKSVYGITPAEYRRQAA